MVTYTSDVGQIKPGDVVLVRVYIDGSINDDYIPAEVLSVKGDYAEVVFSYITNTCHWMLLKNLVRKRIYK